MTDIWLTERLACLRGLKTPNDHQRLLLLLAERPTRTPDEERQLSALVRAEKAVERAQKAGAEAARVVSAGKRAERKARDHELYRVAGLLTLAGLVDRTTSQPTRDRGELLGALLALAHSSPDEPTRAGWKRAGDALLAAAGQQNQAAKPPV